MNACDITAGVLTFNRREDLRHTLSSLFALGIDGLEVLVVDNASTDGTAEMLREQFPPRAYPRLRHVPLESNRGVAARNILFEETETPFLLTLDDDSWPRSVHDVLLMRSVMDIDQRIASVCASCVHPETGASESAGVERFASRSSPDGIHDLLNIAGGGSLLRLEAVRSTAGFDPAFEWGREENDLAFQLVKLNWRVVFFPQAVIYHTFSPAGRDAYERLFRVTRNSFWLLWRYFPLPVAVPVSLLFSLRRLLPVIRDIRRMAPVFRGIREGVRCLQRERRLSRQLPLRKILEHSRWVLKLLYE